MNIRSGLYCPSPDHVYKFWSINNKPLARQVDDLMKKYRVALATSGKNYYESQILELGVRQVGLMNIFGLIVKENYTRNNRTRLRPSDHFRIAFITEDRIKEIKISLGLISGTKENTGGSK
jgi:hypothetical protein